MGKYYPLVAALVVLAILAASTVTAAPMPKGPEPMLLSDPLLPTAAPPLLEHGEVRAAMWAADLAEIPLIHIKPATVVAALPPRPTSEPEPTAHNTAAHASHSELPWPFNWIMAPVVATGGWVDDDDEDDHGDGAQTFVPTNRIIVNHPLAGSPVVLASDPQSETTAAAAPVPALQHPNGPGSHQLMREWLLESEASANAMWYLRPPLIDSPSAQWVQLSSHEGKVEL